MDLVVNKRILNWRVFSLQVVNVTYVNIFQWLTYAVKKKGKETVQAVVFDPSEIDSLELSFKRLMSKPILRRTMVMAFCLREPWVHKATG